VPGIRSCPRHHRPGAASKPARQPPRTGAVAPSPTMAAGARREASDGGSEVAVGARIALP
jgi:hypothetical protein